MAGPIQQLSESTVIRSLRRFRDRYFPTSGKVDNGVVDVEEEESQPGFLDSLPVRQVGIHGNVFVFFSHLFSCQIMYLGEKACLVLL